MKKVKPLIQQTKLTPPPSKKKKSIDKAETKKQNHSHK